MEASGGSPAWQSFVQVDIGKQEPKTLEEIDRHWRAMRWLQVAVQGIMDEEILWYELVTPLTSGAEGAALSLAKHLVTAWLWNIKAHGEDDCPPALSVLNIGQFITDEEAAWGMEEPHWFMAYSRTLQLVGEAAHRRKWEWPRRKALEIKASLLVHALWCETNMDLMMASVKLCWEPTPRQCTTRETMALPLTSFLISKNWLSASPSWKHGTKWCGQPWWLSHAHLQRQSCMVTVGARW